MPSEKPKIPQIQLRSQPVEKLQGDDVKKMLKQRDFFDFYLNQSGKGLEHQYEETERDGEKLVIDHTPGLTWQQSGSDNRMVFKTVQNDLRELNDKQFAGYSDWRLPTLEEAMSLMEPTKNKDGFYINPIFDQTKMWIWTADKESASRAWLVDFDSGGCSNVVIDCVIHVRAVR